MNTAGSCRWTATTTRCTRWKLAEEYLHVVDVLTISEEERLRIANKRKDEKILELETQNDASIREMQKRSDERMERLEDMIQVMAKRLDSLSV